MVKDHEAVRLNVVGVGCVCELVVAKIGVVCHVLVDTVLVVGSVAVTVVVFGLTITRPAAVRGLGGTDFGVKLGQLWQLKNSLAGGIVIIVDLSGVRLKFLNGRVTVAGGKKGLGLLIPSPVSGKVYLDELGAVLGGDFVKRSVHKNKESETKKEKESIEKRPRTNV